MESAIVGGIGIVGTLALGLILWRETRRAGDAERKADRALTKAERAESDLVVEKERREGADREVERLSARLKEVEDREVVNADDDRLAELSSRGVPEAGGGGPPPGRGPVLAGIDGYPGDPDLPR